MNKRLAFFDEIVGELLAIRKQIKDKKYISKDEQTRITNAEAGVLLAQQNLIGLIGGTNGNDSDNSDFGG